MVTDKSDLFRTVIVVDPADPVLLPVFGSFALEVTDGVFARFSAVRNVRAQRCLNRNRDSLTIQ